jgi:hypothetical protein
VAPSFAGPLHQPGAGLPAGTDETFVVLHLLSHGAPWRTFEFLGYKIGRGRGLRHKAGGPSLYALPTDRSIKRFKDKVRTATNRRNPKDLEGVLAELNPIVRAGATTTGARTCAGCSTVSTTGS